MTILAKSARNLAIDYLLEKPMLTRAAPPDECGLYGRARGARHLVSVERLRLYDSRLRSMEGWVWGVWGA
jgi:hypothetical protein